MWVFLDVEMANNAEKKLSELEARMAKLEQGGGM